VKYSVGRSAQGDCPAIAEARPGDIVLLPAKDEKVSHAGRLTLRDVRCAGALARCRFECAEWREIRHEADASEDREFISAWLSGRAGSRTRLFD
jgi:hypothetical protein